MRFNHRCFCTLLGMCFVLGCGTSRQGAWETTVDGHAAHPPQGSRTELLANAESAWAKRDNEAMLATAIENWKAVAAAEPRDAATWTKLSRAMYFHADCFLRYDDAHPAAYKARHEEGTQAAERALTALSPGFAKRMEDGARLEEAISMLNVRAVPALYWRASNLGRWASIDSFATLLSYKDEVRAAMQFNRDRDVEFFYKAPDRYFGVYHARTPGFAGGDREKSREHFRQSILAHPNYLQTRVLQAEELAVKLGDRTMFDDALAYVLSADPESVPEVAPENRCAQKKAKQLKAQAGELF